MFSKRSFLVAICALHAIFVYTKQPIVYSPRYNISYHGLERLHPFDTHKYEKVYNGLCKNFGWTVDDFYTPTPISHELLLTVHTPEYLDQTIKKHETLAYAADLTKIPGNSIWFNKFLISLVKLLPIETLDRAILDPMRLATGGTLLATELAYESGTWAINLAGGYHHAEPENADGFCVFADVAIAIKQLWLKDPNLKIMYIDLDAHQGNGVELCMADELKKENPRLVVFDVYSGNDYPIDLASHATVNKRAYDIRKYIKYDYPLFVDIAHKIYNLPNPVTDELYLPIIRNDLKHAIEETKPDFIFYNAGTDPYYKDQIAHMGLSKAGILERDYWVWKYAHDNAIPLVMTLSGGYTDPKAEGSWLIYYSIQNVLKIWGIEGHDSNIDAGFLSMLPLVDYGSTVNSMGMIINTESAYATI